MLPVRAPSRRLAEVKGKKGEGGVKIGAQGKLGGGRLQEQAFRSIELVV